VDKTRGHPLEGQRVAAAIALGALGFAGIGLMLAKVLIEIGLAISLLCSAGIIWLYYRHFCIACGAFVRKTTYDGIPKTELLIAILIVAISLPTSIAVYFAETKAEPLLNRAFMTLYSVSSEYKGPNTWFLKVATRNIGNLTANNLKGVYVAVILDATRSLSTQIIAWQFQTSINVLDNWDRTPTAFPPVYATDAAINDAAKLGAVMSIDDLA
jgi:hypothetical protein